MAKSSSHADAPSTSQQTPREGILVDCRPSRRKSKPASKPEVIIPEVVEAPPTPAPTPVPIVVSTPTVGKLVRPVLTYGFLAVAVLCVLCVMLLREGEKASATQLATQPPPSALKPETPSAQPVIEKDLAEETVPIPVPPVKKNLRERAKPMGKVPAKAPRAIAFIPQAAAPQQVAMITLPELQPDKEAKPARIPATFVLTRQAVRLLWDRFSPKKTAVLQAKMSPKVEKETECHQTAIEFVKTPQRAMELSVEKKKLVMILHVSGNFEDPGFT